MVWASVYFWEEVITLRCIWASVHVVIRWYVRESNKRCHWTLKHHDVKSFPIGNYSMLIQGIYVTPIVAIGWHNIAWLCLGQCHEERVMTIVDSRDSDGRLVLIIIIDNVTKALKWHVTCDSL